MKEDQTTSNNKNDLGKGDGLDRLRQTAQAERGYRSLRGLTGLYLHIDCGYWYTPDISSLCLEKLGKDIEERLRKGHVPVVELGEDEIADYDFACLALRIETWDDHVDRLVVAMDLELYQNALLHRDLHYWKRTGPSTLLPFSAATWSSVNQPRLFAVDNMLEIHDEAHRLVDLFIEDYRAAKERETRPWDRHSKCPACGYSGPMDHRTDSE